MGKSYSEAKAAAKAAGIPDEDLTPEVIEQFGHDFADPLAALPINEPAITDEEAKKTIAMLQEEAKANAWGTVALKGLSRLTKILICLFITVTLLAATGCGSTAAAQRAVEQMTASAVRADEDYTKIIERLADENRERDLKIAENSWRKAKASVTKKVNTTVMTPITVRTVGADGKTTETQELKAVEQQIEMANPQTLQAIDTEYFRQMAQIEGNYQAVMKRVKTITKNTANVQMLAEGLRAYYQQKTDMLETSAQASEQMLGYLDAWINKRQLPSSPSPTPEPGN